MSLGQHPLLLSPDLDPVSILEHEAPGLSELTTLGVVRQSILRHLDGVVVAGVAPLGRKWDACGWDIGSTFTRLYCQNTSRNKNNFSLQSIMRRNLNIWSGRYVLVTAETLITVRVSIFDRHEDYMVILFLILSLKCLQGKETINDFLAINM